MCFIGTVEISLLSMSRLNAGFMSLSAQETARLAGARVSPYHTHSVGLSVCFCLSIYLSIDLDLQ